MRGQKLIFRSLYKTSMNETRAASPHVLYVTVSQRAPDIWFMPPNQAIKLRAGPILKKPNNTITIFDPNNTPITQYLPKMLTFQQKLVF